MIASKGGTGKSTISWLLAQWLQERVDVTGPVAVYDTDPNNPTLKAFKALSASYIPATTDGELNAGKLDAMMHTIAHATGPTVIDCGSAGFVPVAGYLLSDDIAGVLADYNHRLILHTVVIGGQPCEDTLNGMNALCEAFPPTVPIVVWVNQYDQAYHEFRASPEYLKHQTRISGVVELHRLPALHRAALAKLLSGNLTFREVDAASRTATDGPGTDMMTLSRLRQVRKLLFDQLDAVFAEL